MEQVSTVFDRLTPLLDESCLPIYAIDRDFQIVYCNKSLAAWLGLRRGQIVGKPVEYHSVPSAVSDADLGPPPLTDLCPPPAALAGTQCVGTIANVSRDGRLLHRRAEFVPIDGVEGHAGSKSGGSASRCGVLIVLASADMTPEELSVEISGEATPDELHRAIRRFRHSQAEQFGIESLLGTSSAIAKVRAQVAAAAADRANVIVAGRDGSGRSHVARAIHYQGAEPTDRLLPIDCSTATEEQLRRAFSSARNSGRDGDQATILFLEIQQLPPDLQPLLLAAIREGGTAAKIIATFALPRMAPTRLRQIQSSGRLRSIPIFGSPFRSSRSTFQDSRIGWKICRFWHKAFSKSTTAEGQANWRDPPGCARPAWRSIVGRAN